ncbi:glycosyltransferase family 39 protein [bacterium]|nr:glycosyltransferase family 39 protein [bacterium]
MTNDLKYNYYLFIIIAIASFARIFHLGYYSIWFDEVVSYMYSVKSIPEIIRIAQIDNTPPLYHFLLKYWVLVSKSDFWMRLPSAVFGILSVLMTYKIGILLYPRRTALTAAAFSTLCFQCLHYSQEARMYTMLCFLTLASIYYFILALREGKFIYWAGYFICVIAAFYTHLFIVFILAAQWVYFFISFKETKKLWKTWLAVQLLIGISILPWMSSIIHQIGVIESDYWVPLATIEEVIRVAVFMGTGWDLNNRHIITILLNIPFAVLFFIGLFYSLRGKERSRLLLPVLFFVPLIVVYIYSLNSKSLFFSRYFFYLIPIMHLIMAAGLWRLSKRYRMIIGGLLMIIMVFFAVLYYTSPYNSQPVRFPFRTMAKILEEKIPPGSTIIHLGEYTAGLHSYFCNRWYTESKYNEVVWRETPAPFYCGKQHIPPENCLNDLDWVDSDTLYVYGTEIYDSYFDNEGLLRSSRKVYPRDSIIHVIYDSLWNGLQERGFEPDWRLKEDKLIFYCFIKSGA